MPRTVRFEASGVTDITPVEYVTAACKEAPASRPLVELSDAPQDYPGCAEFLALAPEIQIVWSSAYWELAPASAPTPDSQLSTLVEGCTEAGDGGDLGVAGMLGLNAAAERASGKAHFSMEVVDVEGYMFREDIVMDPLTTVVDTVNAPPGQALVQVIAAGTVTLTSENAGKNAPTYNVLARTIVSAYFLGLDGPVCRTSISRGLPAEYGRTAQGCVVSYGPRTSSFAYPTLANGESVTLSLGGTSTQLQVSVEEAAAISSAIASHTQIWVGFGSAEPVEGGCSPLLPGVSLIWASAEVPGCVIPNIG